MMTFKKSAIITSVVLLLVYIAWWIWPFFVSTNKETVQNSFSLTYGVIAGLGGLFGLIISARWGGFKSLVGKSLIFFSFGLLCQFLGQTSYSIKFLIDRIANSYPSFGEIFFLISIPSYILGIYFIAKASGAQFSMKALHHRLVAIFLPILMMVLSYYMFVRGNIFADQPLINNLLTFVYPVGQATFVSLAIVAYYTTKQWLGGIMKTKVLFILFSLVFQYAADTLFLYKTINGTWVHADESEMLFTLSYAIMTFAFIQFLDVIDRLKVR